MFSFEINEKKKCLSGIMCLIQDVVSPHCGDQRMARRCTRRSLSNYFDMTSYHWNVRQNTVTWRWWMNGKNNVTSYTKCSLSQSIVHILKFVFIEMLDKLITYIVWWYKTVYQVLSVLWTNCITLSRLVVILVHTTDSTWYKVLYHHTMYGSHNRLDLIQSLVPPHYVCNGYISIILCIT
jgi:hypothetical protein